MKSSLEHFKELLLTADPLLTYAEGGRAGDYTTWKESTADDSMSDNTSEDTVWTVYVDRYTKNSKDETARAIKRVLNENEIPFEYEHDYDSQTKYFHHIFKCYVEGYDDEELNEEE